MLQLKGGVPRPPEEGPAEGRAGEPQPRPEEGGSFSSPRSRKCQSLIQDQARELTHLRHKVRTGRAFSSLLIRHVRNTVKTFEELLSSSKMDRCTEQHFREQLARGSQLAESLASKFGNEGCVSEKTPAGQLLRTLSILRKMHAKGEVTEVLKTEREAPPPAPPQSSRQAQSAARHSSSSTSLPREEQQVHPAAAVADVIPATPAGSASPLSDHSDARSAQPACPLSGAAQPGGTPAPGRHGSSGPWDETRPQKMNASGRLSSFSSLYRPNSRPSGADLLEEHLAAIRDLRRRLEESVCANDRLRQRLERGLGDADQRPGTAPAPHHALRVTALLRAPCGGSGASRRASAGTFPALSRSSLGRELGGIDISFK